MPTLDLDDVTLAYDVSGPEDGPPLLLIAGCGQPASAWHLGIVPPLAAAGYRVITYDNRGVDPSSSPPGPYSVAQMAGDALALLDALGIHEALVAGHSLGGWIAETLVAEHPERIRAAALMGSANIPTAWEVAITTVERDLSRDYPDLPRLYYATETLRYLPISRIQDTEEVAGWLELIADLPPWPNPGRLAQYEACLAWSTNPTHGVAWPTIDRPCLVLAFEHDVDSPPRYARVAAEQIRGSRYLEIPDAGHLGIVTHGAQVADALIDFYGTIGPKDKEGRFIKKSVLQRARTLRFVGLLVMLCALPVAIAIVCAILRVVSNPLGQYSLPGSGKRDLFEWPRLLVFLLPLLADFLILAFAGITLIRTKSETSSDANSKTAGTYREIFLKFAVLFPVVALGAFLYGYAHLYRTPHAQTHFGVLSSICIVSAAVVFIPLAAPTLVGVYVVFRTRMVRSSVRNAILSVALVVAGVGIPLGAIAIGVPGVSGYTPSQFAVITSGFSELLSSPDPHVGYPTQLTCGDSTHCLIEATTGGLGLQEPMGASISTTADGGQSWHSALLAPTTGVGERNFTCKGDQCWGLVNEFPLETTDLVSVSIVPSGQPTVINHEVKYSQIQSQGPGTCWSSTDCIVLGSLSIQVHGYPIRSSPTAFVTTDEGRTWQQDSIPVLGAVSATLTDEGFTGPWCNSLGSCVATLSLANRRCTVKFGTASGGSCPTSVIVLRTTDGGASWESNQLFPFSKLRRSVTCSIRPVCLAFKVSTIDTHDLLSHSIASTDTGKIWGGTIKLLPHTSRIMCSLSQCIDAVTHPNSGDEAAISTDWGRHWKSHQFNSEIFPEPIFAMTCAPADRCLVSAWNSEKSAPVAVANPKGDWKISSLPPPKVPGDWQSHWIE